MIMNMNPKNNFDVNAEGVEVMANIANNGDLPSVSFDQDGIQVTNTELPFGDDDAKAEEYNSPKRRRDQVATTATLLGITGSTRNKKFLIGGIGSAALLALAWSVPNMKESHVNKNSAAVIRKPDSAKSSKAPFAKVTKAKAPKASGSVSSSLEPSLTPSKSDGPPSLTPSASGGPTLGPSFTPSESDGPTLEPSLTLSASGGPLLGYEFVADNGYCADSHAPQESDVLPWVLFLGSAGSSPSACASKCTECVSVDGAVSNGSFRGFTFDCGYCLCHVDNGSTYTYNPGAECAGTIQSTPCFGFGTGEILGVVDSGQDENPNCDAFEPATVCYKYLPSQQQQ